LREESEFGKEFFSMLKDRASELDWFMFETRIRTVIQELVEPLQDTTTTYVTKSDSEFKEIYNLMRRVEEMEFAMQKV